MSSHWTGHGHLAAMFQSIPVDLQMTTTGKVCLSSANALLVDYAPHQHGLSRGPWQTVVALSV